MTDAAKSQPIDRWRIEPNANEVIGWKVPGGEWCSYDDVAPLLQRIAELEAEVKRLKTPPGTSCPDCGSMRFHGSIGGDGTRLVCDGCGRNMIK